MNLHIDKIITGGNLPVHKMNCRRNVPVDKMSCRRNVPVDETYLSTKRTCRQDDLSTKWCRQDDLSTKWLSTKWMRPDPHLPVGDPAIRFKISPDWSDLDPISFRVLGIRPPTYPGRKFSFYSSTVNEHFNIKPWLVKITT